MRPARYIFVGGRHEERPGLALLPELLNPINQQETDEASHSCANDVLYVAGGA